MMGERTGDHDAPGRIVDVLQHRRRREILEQLLASGGDLSLVGLACRLDRPGHETLPDVVVELQHVHLPELDRRGCVEFDTETGSVSLGLEPDTIEMCLDAARGET